MSLADTRRQVELAEQRVKTHRAAVGQHLRQLREDGSQLLTPTRIVVGGLALGVLLDRLRGQSHKRRTRKPKPEQPAHRARSADSGLIDTLTRSVNLLSAAMPLLMPLIAHHSAERAVEEATETAQKPAPGATRH